MKLPKVLLALACVVFALVARATVPSPNCFVQYTLTTNPQTLPVTYVFTNSTDLLVLDTRAPSGPIVLTQNSDYSVSGGAGSTGSVATIPGGANGVLVNDIITIIRGVPLTQTTSFTNTGPFTASMVGQAFDKQTEISQQINLGLLNALRFPSDETLSGLLPLTLRKSKLLGFDANGAAAFYPPSSGGGGGGSGNVVGPSVAVDSDFASFNSTTGLLIKDSGFSPAYFNSVAVESYGAVGNGSTDDTTAISNAITAAGANGIVVFRAGKTYKTTSQISIPNNGVTLWGYGAIITSDTQAHFQKFQFSGRGRGLVAGLRFTCLYVSGGTGLSAGVIEILGSNDIEVRDCEFDDVEKNGVYIFGSSLRDSVRNCRFNDTFAAIFVDDDGTNQPTRLNLVDNRIYSGIGSTSTALSGGIKLSGTGNANTYVGDVISGNQLDSPGQVGIELQTWVNGCTIVRNTVNGAGIGLSISGCANDSLTGNNATACANYGVEIASSAIKTSVTGGTVNGANSSGTATTQYGVIVNQSTYTTISGVITSLCTGEEINVVQSNYTSLNGCTTTGLGWLVKDSLDTQISGNTFVAGASAGYFIFADSSDSDVTSLNITGNTFVGTLTANGILLYAPANNITDVLISKNICSNAQAPGWLYNTSISGSGAVKRVRDEGNVGDGSQDFVHNFDVPLFATSSNTSLDFRYDTILVNASGGARTITLPDATNFNGKKYTVVKTDSSGNAVTVATTSSQSISGNNAGGTFVSATTYSLAAQGARVTPVSDSSNWQILQAR